MIHRQGRPLEKQEGHVPPGFSMIIIFKIL